MFKIAYGAGHYLHTAGKRLPKELDATQTREWVLNDRVARYFAEAAGQYEGVALLRVDDATGNKEITLGARCRAANQWGADMCLAIHHNAGINLGTGGGICAFAYKEGTKAAEYRDAIYDACIAAGGLKGNRYDPTLTADFYVLLNTNAPAVLMEYGFMDSKTDAPVILTEAYSKLVAYATMEGIAKAAGLKKKVAQEEEPQGYTLSFRYLQEGSEGEDVRTAQQLLTAKGFSLSADGIFGPKTKQAVVQFQKKQGIAADGVVGETTMARLWGL